MAGVVTGRRRHIGTAAAGLALVLVQQAQGETARTPRLTFDLSTGVTHDDNPTLGTPAADPATTLDTRLGLHLNTSTRAQTLAFSVEGLAQLSQDGAKLRDPSAKLSYDRDNGNSHLSFTGLYDRAPVDLFDPVVGSDGSVSSTDVIATKGTITTSTAGFSFATGLQAPLGFDLSADYTGHAYSDTSDPAVYDNATQTLKAATHLRLGSGDEISLTADQTRSDYEDAAQTRRRSQELAVGYTRALRPDLKLDASLGQTAASTRRTGAVEDKSTGLTGHLGLDRSLANGTASVTLSSDRDSLGARQKLSFGRSLDLPTGKLAAEAGVSARSGAQGQFVGSLSWSSTLPTESFTGSLSRTMTLTADDVDVANTALQLTYQHQINDVSKFGLSLDVFATDSAGTGTRQSLSATWSHDLTRDWQLTAGYEYRSVDRDTTGKAQSNSVFLTVNRKFVLLP